MMGELYTMLESKEAKKVDIQINSDDDFNTTKLIDVKGDVSEIVLSPNGKELAFVARGKFCNSFGLFQDKKNYKHKRGAKHQF